MDTKKLRQKILDLAIRGKLVPQDPNDEPASVLLERIRAEKERLIKEGKIKRSKKSAKSSDTPHYENIDFALPENWQLSTLGEVFYMHAGKNIVASEISPNADETYRYKCIGGNGLRGYVQQFNTEGSFPIIGRQGALCGNINYVEGRFYATEHAVVVDTFCETNVKWAFYFLIQLNLNQYATATAQPGLSVNTIGDVQIPIPPKEEQCRIVSYIEQCFRTIDTLERGKDELEENIKNTKSKILDLAIHGKLVPQDPNDEPAIDLLRRINPSFVPCDNAQYPYEVPKSWIWVRLDNICEIKGGKRIPRGETFSSVPTSHIYIRVTNMKNNTIIDNEIKYITEDVYRQIKNYTIGVDDLYLTIAGTIGEVGSVPRRFDGMNLTENAARLTNIVCLKNYLKTALQSSVAQEHFISKFHQVAQPKLSIETASSTLIPLPPYNEQLRIVAKIQELFAVLDEILKSIEA